MSLKYQEAIADAGKAIGQFNPEYAARMRLQNRFKTGLDIAKYTAGIMRRDMAAYDNDTSKYTQSLGCWHGFVAQQKLISIKKHFKSTERRYLYLSGWMVAGTRSKFGPLPDQSMHEKTVVADLIEEIYTFLKQADARELDLLSPLWITLVLPKILPKKKKFWIKSTTSKPTLCRLLRTLTQVSVMWKPLTCSLKK